MSEAKKQFEAWYLSIPRTKSIMLRHDNGDYVENVIQNLWVAYHAGSVYIDQMLDSYAKEINCHHLGSGEIDRNCLYCNGTGIMIT